MNHLATIFVSAVIAIVMVLIVVNEMKKRKKGGGCGCGCSNCGMADVCHGKQEQK